MKKLPILLLAFIVASIFACSDDEENWKGWTRIDKIQITLLPSVYNHWEDDKEDITNEGTRMQTTLSSSTLRRLYELGDSFGIFPKEGFQIPFAVPLPPGVTNSTVTLTAQGWMTKDSLYYAAYLPYQRLKWMGRFWDHIPWDYRKVLRQNGNANTNANQALNAVPELTFVASDTIMADSGEFSFNFKHLGVVVRIGCKMPTPGIWKKMMVACSSPVFGTHGYYNIFSATQEFNPSGMTDHICLYLDNNAQTTSPNEYLRGFIVFPPCNWSGTRMTAYVWDDSGNLWTGYKDVASNYGPWNKNDYGSFNFTNMTLTTNCNVMLNPWEENFYLSGVAI